MELLRGARYPAGDCAALDIDSDPGGNHVVGNRVTGDGTDPDLERRPAAAFAADLASDTTGVGNCWARNVAATMFPRSCRPVPDTSSGDGMARGMRFYVERSSAGGYHVKMRGTHAPISWHDTEDDAEARRDAYARGAAAHATERLTLRDGSVVVVRPLERDDRPLVQAVFDHMDKEARYRRFLGYKKRLSTTDLEALTAVDHHCHEALAALDAETGEALGVARMLQERRRSDTAEASVAVADAWQGRGLGGMLLDRLARRAREEGVRRFTAVLLTRNVAMLHLFEHTGSVHVTARYGDTLELAVELRFETGAPREALRAAARGEVRG